MTFCLFLVGFVSMLAQVVILRELNVAFYGIELIYALAIGAWLLSTATGALILRSRKPSRAGITFLFSFLAVILPLDILFLRGSRFIFSGVPGAYLSFFQQLAIMLLSIAPAGIPLGLLFQRAARLYIEKDRSMAFAYAVESAGGLLGGLASTLVARWGAQNYALAVICAMACLIPAAYPRLALSCRVPAIVLAPFLMLALCLSNPIERATAAWNHQGLLITRDTPYGRVTLTGLASQIAVFENDALAFETQDREIEAFAHLPALQHSSPVRNMLVLGGMDGTVKELLKYKPERIDCVELNGTELDLVLSHVPAEMRDWFTDARVNLRIADPRRFVQGWGDTYDLIMVGMPEPVSGQANRFYTKEFFSACALLMKPDAILALRLHSGENLLTTAAKDRMESIYAALRAVFPEVLFLPGETNIVTASFAPLPTDPEILIDRWRRLAIPTLLISPPYIRYLYSNDRFFEIRDMLETAKAPMNTDLRPVCYQYTLMIWLSKFFPSLATKDMSQWGRLSLRSSGVLLLCVALFFVAIRKRTGIRRILLAGTAGFAGMALESVAILYYQVKYGVLYQDIGVLLMSFMAGLALGAWAIEKGVSGRRERVRLWGGVLLLAFCVLCGFVCGRLYSGHAAGLAETGSILTATGFLVAGVFVCASRYDLPDQGKAVSPLYAADLFGGCIAALLAGLFAIPSAGLLTTTLWAGSSAALALLLL
jgi:spermidine synthase